MLIRSPALLLLALGASSASAQRPVARPVGAVRPLAVSAPPAPSALTSAAAAKLSRAGRAGIGAVAGTLLGAGIGAVLAWERVHRPAVTDHSEDGLAYLAFVGGGAIVGMATGTVVGLAWPSKAIVAADVDR